MEEINYKEKDRKSILDYMRGCGGEIEVGKIISESGANRLRVYSLLYELQLEGIVEVTRENDMGTPESVKLCSE